VAEIVLYVATSLDGYIARNDGSTDWLPESGAGYMDYGYDDFYETIDALLMEAGTCEKIDGFGSWPHNEKGTLILASKDFASEQRDMVFVKSGIQDLISAVNDKGYKRVWLVGGGRLVSSFVESGFIDELVIAIIPFILGSGIRVYEHFPETDLQLFNCVQYPCGAVVLSYKIV